MDLIVRSARLRHRDDLADIGIAGGRIARDRATHHRRRPPRSSTPPAASTTPSFVEPHIHLDKALTAERARENPTNVFEESIAIMREVKRAYTVEDVADRATRVIHGLVGARRDAASARTSTSTPSSGSGRSTGSWPPGSAAGTSRGSS